MVKSSSAWLQLPPALAAKAAAAGQQRALKVAKPPHEKASPAFNVSTLREKEKGCIFD